MQKHTSCHHGHVHIHRELSCEHQIAIEAWPETAEVYFSNERYIDPVNTQVRFDAAVYNAPTSRVLWEVRDALGNPGLGTIDKTGLYTAPPKTPLVSNGTTEIISATAADDPLRKAFVYVTLVGRGPAPDPVPIIKIFPRHGFVYYTGNYGSDFHNEYIDHSNQIQCFHAIITNTKKRTVRWDVNGSEQFGQTTDHMRFNASGYGANTSILIRATLHDFPTIYDEIPFDIENYTWPALQVP